MGTFSIKVEIKITHTKTSYTTFELKRGVYNMYTEVLTSPKSIDSYHQTLFHLKLISVKKDKLPYTPSWKIQLDTYQSMTKLFSIATTSIS